MIAKTVRDNLLAIANAYRKATGKSLTQVSKEFYGNAKFFVQLKAGEHSISVSKLDEMLAKFRQEWPADAPWPFVRPLHMGQRVPK